ncbi:hypothetical protein COTS27_00434 [Spirochaetota bacterium]|nr:hypothetical protein COTS27_00434 [Spirochaetota bacterium]
MMIRTLLQKYCFIVILGITYLTIPQYITLYGVEEANKETHLPPLHRELFTYEGFSVESYIVQSSVDKTFSYIIKVLEQGKTSHVALEFGNTPFGDLIVHNEYIANTKFVPYLSTAADSKQNNKSSNTIADNKQSKESKESSNTVTDNKQSNINPAQRRIPYIVTTYTYECAPLENQSRLDLAEWEIFALVDNKVFPIPLAAKTLTWEQPNTKKVSLWQSFNTSPYRTLIIILVIMTGIMVILGVIRIITYYHRKREIIEKSQRLVWQTFQTNYKKQNIEDLYYQLEKETYFQAVKHCIETTLASFQSKKEALPPKIKQKFNSLNKNIEHILKKLTEHDSSPHLTAPSHSPANPTSPLTTSGNPLSLSQTRREKRLPKTNPPSITPAELSFLTIKKIIGTPL